MLKIIGLVRKGEKYYRGQELFQSDFIFVTPKQMDKMMKAQKDPSDKGIFWVNDRVFRMSDIAFAKELDLDDNTTLWHITRNGNLKRNQYLFEALEKEGIDISKYTQEKSLPR